jgi:hypothetical protein
MYDSQLEVLRRGLGNIFRLEDEQLSYTQVRRATRDVKVPLPLLIPLHLSAHTPGSLC